MRLVRCVPWCSGRSCAAEPSCPGPCTSHASLWCVHSRCSMLVFSDLSHFLTGWMRVMAVTGSLWPKKKKLISSHLCSVDDQQPIVRCAPFSETVDIILIRLISIYLGKSLCVNKTIPASSKHLQLVLQTTGADWTMRPPGTNPVAWQADILTKWSSMSWGCCCFTWDSHNL